MYLSDLRVYFKEEVYFIVTWSGMEEYKNRRKISGLCQHYQRWIYCWSEGFIPWLINLQLFLPKLIKWLPVECADWFFDNTMTWSYYFHRRYSMSRQKNSILINEHALNREPVALKLYARPKLSSIDCCQNGTCADYYQETDKAGSGPLRNTIWHFALTTSRTEMSHSHS